MSQRSAGCKISALGFFCLLHVGVPIGIERRPPIIDSSGVDDFYNAMRMRGSAGTLDLHRDGRRVDAMHPQFCHNWQFGDEMFGCGRFSMSNHESFRVTVVA
ncbi:uncharacterized protein BDV14DRAFT_181206 [Aspergillus stella-maris]|uniref:uncharacterized protein n=1 Tax=Aspergillus stella-maris TaxID=1810926 RepID=UPI003CCCDACB